MLILAAVLPAAILLVLVYAADRNKEQAPHVFTLYLVGALVVLPAGLFERALLDIYRLTPDAGAGLLATLITSFFIAGVTEEGLKWLIFRRLVYDSPAFDEPYDGVLYAVAIGLGFATVENVLYVTSYGWDTALVRAFTAVPAHMMFGVAMGYAFSRARFEGAAMWPAFVVPALLHGGYDTFALARSLWANAGLVLYLVLLVRFTWVRLLRARQESPSVHRTAPALVQRRS